MNKFYYIEGFEIKEIETVKDLEFIQKKIDSSAVAAIEEIEIPPGYTLNGMLLEMTPLANIENLIANKLSELSATDSDMSRITEDVIAVLDANNNTLKKDDLPQDAQDKLLKRATLREELSALYVLLDEL